MRTGIPCRQRLFGGNQPDNTAFAPVLFNQPLDEPVAEFSLDDKNGFLDARQSRLAL